MKVLDIPLERGDQIRLRRLGSEDEWCYAIVELLSPNKASAGLRVLNGGLVRTTGNPAFLGGAMAVSFTETTATEVTTGTLLEIEYRKPAG